MQTGRHLLREWLTRSSRNQRDLAKLLDISEAYCSQILGGARRPKMELLFEIERVTGVPAKSWLDSRRGKSDQRAIA
jgi:transcriptional regulator with XRE-family HTH domain